MSKAVRGPKRSKPTPAAVEADSGREAPEQHEKRSNTCGRAAVADAPAAFYSVRDTCRMLNLKPHVLRYWEREFGIKVKRNSAGRRIYSDRQVEEMRLIRHLIREEKLTTRGAKQKLAQVRPPGQQALVFDDPQDRLLRLKQELIAIRGLLEPGN